MDNTDLSNLIKLTFLLAGIIQDSSIGLGFLLKPPQICSQDFREETLYHQDLVTSHQ